MIDLVLQGTAANIRALLKGRGLIDANDVAMPGFDYCLWAGSGKFMTADGANPTYLTGVVVLARIATKSDAINEGAEQWQRSQVAKWIKANGTLSTFGGMPCYTVASVRMMRADDVFAWCAAKGLPAHEWAGGNTL
jgi:hypothetical protein